MQGRNRSRLRFLVTDIPLLGYMQNMRPLIFFCSHLLEGCKDILKTKTLASGCITCCNIGHVSSASRRTTKGKVGSATGRLANFLVYTISQKTGHFTSAKNGPRKIGINLLTATQFLSKRRAESSAPSIGIEQERTHVLTNTEAEDTER